MTDIRIGLAELRELARAQIDLAGADYVYEKPGDDPNSDVCLYVHAGQPSCIIGRILHAKGVTIAELASYDSPPNGQIAMSARSLPYWSGQDAIEWANVLQCEQDHGSSWGEAFALAELTIIPKQRVAA